MDKPQFDAGNFGANMKRWWSHENGPYGSNAIMANLRRTTSPEELSLQHAVMQITHRLNAPFSMVQTIGTAAGVLAWVKRDCSTATAKILPTAGMSPMHLKRLLETDDLRDRLVQFRRMLGFTKRRANVADLAQSVLEWHYESRRSRWLYDYCERKVDFNSHP